MTPRSIRQRLLRRLFVTIFAVMTLLSVGLYFHLRNELLEEYNAALSTKGRSVAAVLDASWSEPDHIAVLKRAFPRLHFERADGHRVQIWRRDDVLIATSHPDTPQLLQRPFDGATHTYIFNPVIAGTSERAVQVTFGKDRHRPRFAIVLVEDGSELSETLATLALALLIIGGAATGISVWLVSTIVRREFEPLQSFSQMVTQIDAEKLTYRFDAANLRSELVPIAERLNELLERIEVSFTREKRFSANVAHELRTPLAELRTMIEVAQRWPLAGDELAKHHDKLLEVTIRMSALVQTLLAMVRREGASTDSMQLISLEPTIRAAWNRVSQVASSRQVTAEFQASDGTLRGDPILFTRLIDNLLENAASYAPAGSIVQVSMGPGTIAISNQSDELTQNDLKLLEEPFWRKDAFRTRRDRAGLGLSLVKEYANVLGLDVRYTLSDEGRFTVTLEPRP